MKPRMFNRLRKLPQEKLDDDFVTRFISAIREVFHNEPWHVVEPNAAKAWTGQRYENPHSGFVTAAVVSGQPLRGTCT